MNDLVEKLMLGMGAAALVAVVLGFAALISGTVLWLIWDPTISLVFPTIVEFGYIAKAISWWTAVKFSWICGILIKATSSISKNENGKG